MCSEMFALLFSTVLAFSSLSLEEAMEECNSKPRREQTKCLEAINRVTSVDADLKKVDTYLIDSGLKIIIADCKAASGNTIWCVSKAMNERQKKMLKKNKETLKDLYKRVSSDIRTFRQASFVVENIEDDIADHAKEIVEKKQCETRPNSLQKRNRGVGFWDYLSVFLDSCIVATGIALCCIVGGLVFGIVMILLGFGLLIRDFHIMALKRQLYYYSVQKQLGV